MKTTHIHSSSPSDFRLPDKVLELLAADGLEVDTACSARLARHAALVRKWNDYTSLVSTGDLDHLVEHHIVDALSLAGRIAASGGPHVDIGSGGGFPAIPVKCLLPELPLVLIERSAKKCGFLRKVLGALGIEGVRLVQGEFPAAAAGFQPRTVTARAVERPQVVLPAMAEWLSGGAVFLAQSSEPGKFFGEQFHVEPVADAWTASGLRRGSLHTIRRKDNTGA